MDELCIQSLRMRKKFPFLLVNLSSIQASLSGQTPSIALNDLGELFRNRTVTRTSAVETVSLLIDVAISGNAAVQPSEARVSTIWTY